MLGEYCIDQEVLADLKDVMGADYPALISVYIEDTKKKLQSLEVALSSEQAEDVRIISHSLKGSSSNLGANTLTTLCQQLEKIGVSGDLQGASGLLGDINAIFLQVQSEITKDL